MGNLSVIGKWHPASNRGVKIKAFILIETTAGKAKEVTTALKQLDEVKSVDAVMGSYDVIAILEAESMTNITPKIKAIPGISRTVVCITVSESGGK